VYEQLVQSRETPCVCVCVVCSVDSDTVREFHLAVMRLDGRKVLCLLRNADSLSDTVNSRDHLLRTAAMLIARRPPSDCRCRSHVRRSMLDILFEAGAQLDLVDSAGNTALMYAVMSSSADIVDWLLEAGADPRRANYIGVTPLWQSVFDMTSRRKHDQWPIIRRLLMTNCAVDHKCRGPLLFAYGTEYVYCYEEPVSALDVAVDCGCQSTARLLVGAGCSCSTSLMMSSMTTTEHDGTASWLDELLAESRSLQQLCRLAIHRSVGPRLETVVQSLCLPVQLKAFLLLDNIPEPSHCTN